MKYIYFVSYFGKTDTGFIRGRIQIATDRPITESDHLLATEKKIAEDTKTSKPIITNFILLRTEAE